MMFEEDEQMNAIEDEPANGEMAIPLTADFQQIFENAGDEGNTDTVIVESDLSTAILADSPPRMMPPPRPVSMTGQLIPLKLKSDDNQLIVEFPHNHGENVHISNVSISKPVAQQEMMKEVIPKTVTKSFDTTAGRLSVAPANAMVVIQAGSSKATQKIMTLKQAQQLGLLSKGPIVVSSVWKPKTNNIIQDQPPKMNPAQQRNSTDVVKNTSAKSMIVKLADQINRIPIPANQVSIVVLPGKRKQNAISSELGASRASTSQKKCEVATNTPTLIKTAQSPKFTNKLSDITAHKIWSCSKSVFNLCNCKNCLETNKYHASNPSASRPKITKDKASGPGCNCESFACCENYCECRAVNIACSANSECTGCENVSLEDILKKLSDVMPTASSKISVDSERATMPSDLSNLQIIETITKSLVDLANDAMRFGKDNEAIMQDLLILLGQCLDDDIQCSSKRYLRKTK